MDWSHPAEQRGFGFKMDTIAFTAMAGGAFSLIVVANWLGLLGQADTGHDFHDLLLEGLKQGPLFAIIVIFLWGIYKIAWWVAKKLFGEEEDHPGLAVRWYNAYEGFLDGLSKRDQMQVENCQTHIHILQGVQSEMHRQSLTLEAASDLLKNLMEWAGDSNAPFSTKRLNESIIDVAKIELLKLKIVGELEASDKLVLEQDIEKIWRGILERHKDAIDQMARTKRERLRGLSDTIEDSGVMEKPL